MVVGDDDDDVVQSGDENEDDNQPATCKDYMLHFISFFWKFLFAFVPPTSKGIFQIDETKFLIRSCWWMVMFLYINSNHWYAYCSNRRFSDTCKLFV